MAMQLDVTTVIVTKLKALRTAGSGGASLDTQTAFDSYVDTVVGTSASAARKDVTTRVWLNLPHT